jgi:hypothetical protein
MSNMHNVVTSLRAEYNRLQKDLERVGKALHALGNANGSHNGVKRILSKEARERIAEAQRQRWAKVRKQQNAKS